MTASNSITRRTTLSLAAGAAAATQFGCEQGDTAMERVTGIGGFFFRAKDPDGLAKWYEDNFGINSVPKDYGGTPWTTEAGTTVFAPFKETTTYFGDMRLKWMINFRVRDIDKMAAQLRKNGITVEIDPETYPNGRFGKLNDPEGNPIQLWEPGGVDKS